MVWLHLFVFLCVVGFGAFGSKETNAAEVHPRNKQLVEKGLLPPEALKYFPDVPKITPHEALGLYTANKAVFIAIGYDTPRLTDGWLLKDYMRFDPSRLKLYGISTKDKYIVPY